MRQRTRWRPLLHLAHGAEHRTPQRCLMRENITRLTLCCTPCAAGRGGGHLPRDAAVPAPPPSQGPYGAGGHPMTWDLHHSRCGGREPRPASFPGKDACRYLASQSDISSGCCKFRAAILSAGRAAALCCTAGSCFLAAAFSVYMIGEVRPSWQRRCPAFPLTLQRKEKVEGLRCACAADRLGREGAGHLQESMGLRRMSTRPKEHWQSDVGMAGCWGYSLGIAVVLH